MAIKSLMGIFKRDAEHSNVASLLQDSMIHFPLQGNIYCKAYHTVLLSGTSEVMNNCIGRHVLLRLFTNTVAQQKYHVCIMVASSMSLHNHFHCWEGGGVNGSLTDIFYSTPTKLSLLTFNLFSAPPPPKKLMKWHFGGLGDNCKIISAISIRRRYR